MMRRQSIGQEGATAEFCDLSGRGLSTSQVERTLRVFDTAVAIDMSNNELEHIPTTIAQDLVALDVSFNLIAHAHGLERLQFLQELNLGYNRLADVTILEFCPLLQRVNLSGNRLTNTRGIETLVHLENLNLSDNLIEYSEALRALSMNRNLTHLTIHGNPIAHKTGVDYRVLVLDMIPSVLILDDKKIRTSTKNKHQQEPQSCSSAAAANAPTTKSLSYSRIYDDKKQFVIRHQHTRRTPATRPSPILLGDPALPPKYEGNTMFLQSPKTTTMAQDLSVPYPCASADHRSSPRHLAPPPPPPQQSHLVSSTSINTTSGIRLASPTAPPPAAPYMSLYDRLAAANGIPVAKSPPPPPLVTEPASNQTQATKRPTSSHARRNNETKTGSSTTSTTQAGAHHPPPSTQTEARRSGDAATTRPLSRGGTPAQPQTSSASHSATYPGAASSPRRQSQSTRSPPRVASLSASSAVPQAVYFASSPTSGALSQPNRTNHHHINSAQAPQAHAQVQAQAAQSTPSHSLDPKQQNVLSVIQNLIHHKKQTLATLARQSASSSTHGATTATTVYS